MIGIFFTFLLFGLAYFALQTVIGFVFGATIKYLAEIGKEFYGNIVLEWLVLILIGVWILLYIVMTGWLINWIIFLLTNIWVIK